MKQLRSKEELKSVWLRCKWGVTGKRLESDNDYIKRKGLALIERLETALFTFRRGESGGLLGGVGVGHLRP